jgi:hypothetical protein
MIQLVAEIEHTDSPDIFDYMIEAVEMLIVQTIRTINYFTNLMC